MKKIIICRGISCSGKTTYALSWVNEDPENRIRLSMEEYGKHFFVLKDVMRIGKDIIIDDKNLDKDSLNNLLNIINYQNGYLEHKYEIIYKDFFDISVDECVKRDSLRSNSKGEDFILKEWKKYKHFIQTTEVEKYVNNLRAWDIGKPTCIVVDMDSTLCFNTTKRPWFGEGAAEGMKNDIPNGNVLDIIFTLSNTYPIILATGRDTSQEQVTLEWLANHEIYPNECYFRTEGDHRKGVEVKREQIEKIASKYNILAIFDDCEPIVKMYREMGFTVLQPNKGL